MRDGISLKSQSIKSSIVTYQQAFLHRMSCEDICCVIPLKMRNSTDNSFDRYPFLRTAVVMYRISYVCSDNGHILRGMPVCLAY